MNKRKQIGCPGWVLEGKFFGISLSYLKFIQKFGDLVTITPEHVDNPPEIDLLMLPGGADMNPLSFGAIPAYETKPPNLILEHFDANILPQYIKRETPTMGICRGLN